jgi:hypothetical protein
MAEPGYIMVIENTPERQAAQESAWKNMVERELGEEVELEGGEDEQLDAD